MRNRAAEIRQEYFEWLYDLVGGVQGSRYVSYRKLLEFLHSVEFTYTISRDENRAKDGINLRYRFSLGYDGVLDILEGPPCSILEMMAALAIRCEETIMDDALIGDRTGQWFWNMIVSLGLGSMTDNNFDESYAEDVVKRFLERKYERNGKGGLFTVRDCKRDLRKVEIWYQLCWYLDTIV